MFTKIAISLERSMLLFATILITFYILRPRILFDEHTGRPRPFGLGYNRDWQKRTLFSLPTMIPAVACLCWVIAGDS